MNSLPDGTYDVFIVDAEDIDDVTARIELTVVSGEFKSEVIALRATNLGRAAIDLIGLPATLMVDAGVPRVELD